MSQGAGWNPLFHVIMIGAVMGMAAIGFAEAGEGAVPGPVHAAPAPARAGQAQARQQSAGAEPSGSALQRAPSSVAGETPIDVRGQMRSWSNLAGGRAERDVIDFVRTRVDYREEIESQGF